MTLVEWIRRPTGQLWLFGATFALAIVAAIVLASARPFFAGLMREEYGAASSVDSGIVERFVTDRDWTPTAEDLEPLYRHWMRGDGKHLEEVALRLADEDPEWLVARLERTLVAGSAGQRRRALLLVERTRLSAARDVLIRMIDRAGRMGQAAWVEELTPIAEKLR